MKILYHSKDLDGKASGAIAGQVYPNAKLIGYHYGDKFDKRTLNRSDVMMIDVTFDPEEVISTAKKVISMTIIDHHISFKESFLELLGDYKTLDLGDITLFYSNNIKFYYSSILSACEMTCKLFYENLTYSKYLKTNVQMLGQYDTRRDSDEKMIVNDQKWETILKHQYGLRAKDDSPFLDKLYDDLSLSDNSIHCVNGSNVLRYLRIVNRIKMKDSFIFEFEGIKVLACNGVDFNSQSFDGVYDETEVDAMMPFKYNGLTDEFNFSLYTTKDDIDILSIAKKYNGGGHKKACGFSISSEFVKIENNKIEIKNENE